MVHTRVGDYMLLDTIGEGTFGKVKHAVHERTGDQFAVKVMDRRNIRENDLTLQVRKEISVMMSLHHKNVVKLYQVLSTSARVYIVMDLVTGGELFDEILERKRLPEDMARHYFLQLIDGLEHCHLRGVYHRDLKPENLLLDSSGSLKITDFGLSTLRNTDPSDTLYTQCGTPNYVAPEIISGASQGYSGAKADIWSCGVILYVLLAGFLPFDDEDPDKLFALILNCEMEYPQWFSEQAIDLLTNILRVDSRERYTIRQILAHPWCIFQSSGGEVLYAPSEKVTRKNLISLDNYEFITEELSNSTTIHDFEPDIEPPATPRHRRRAHPSVPTGGEDIAYPEGTNFSPLPEPQRYPEKRTSLGSGQEHSTAEGTVASDPVAHRSLHSRDGEVLIDVGDFGHSASMAGDSPGPAPASSTRGSSLRSDSVRPWDQLSASLYAHDMPGGAVSRELGTDAVQSPSARTESSSDSLEGNSWKDSASDEGRSSLDEDVWTPLDSLANQGSDQWLKPEFRTPTSEASSPSPLMAEPVFRGGDDSDRTRRSRLGPGRTLPGGESMLLSEPWSPGDSPLRDSTGYAEARGTASPSPVKLQSVQFQNIQRMLSDRFEGTTHQGNQVEEDKNHVAKDSASFERVESLPLTGPQLSAIPRRLPDVDESGPDFATIGRNMSADVPYVSRCLMDNPKRPMRRSMSSERLRTQLHDQTFDLRELGVPSVAKQPPKSDISDDTFGDGLGPSRMATEYVRLGDIGRGPNSSRGDDLRSLTGQFGLFMNPIRVSDCTWLNKARDPVTEHVLQSKVAAREEPAGDGAEFIKPADLAELLQSCGIMRNVSRAWMLDMTAHQNSRDPPEVPMAMDENMIVRTSSLRDPASVPEILEDVRFGSEQLFSVGIEPKQLGSDVASRSGNAGEVVLSDPVRASLGGQADDAEALREEPLSPRASALKTRANAGVNGVIKLADLLKVRNPLHVKRYTQFNSLFPPAQSSSLVIQVLKEMGCTFKSKMQGEEVYKIKSQIVYNRVYIVATVEVYRIDDVLTAVSFRRSRTSRARADQRVFIDFYREVYRRFCQASEPQDMSESSTLV